MWWGFSDRSARYFRGASMANDEHVALLKQGVAAWNAWRVENPNIRPDLTKADLKGADLCRANLKEVDLKGADLRGAKLARANLAEATLNEANLAGANLQGAILLGTELSVRPKTF